MGRRKKTKEEFIADAIAVHGLKYDYSLVEYVGNAKKVKIVCKTHGIFEQIPNSHLRDKGCIACSFDKQKSNSEDFIQKAIAVHGTKYEYNLVDYVGALKKVKIVCKTHGIFEQIPASHLAGNGCAACYYDKQKSNTEEFIQKSISIHGTKYDYSNVVYVGVFKKVKIVCNVHGTFEQQPTHHLSGNGCPKCVSIVSKGEIEVFEFIKTLTNNVEQSNRKILKPKELDIYCPDEKIAVEFDGLFFHSSHKFSTHEKMKKKQLFKSPLCERLDIRLFHITDMDWKHRQEIVKSILTNAFNKSEYKQYAVVKSVSKAVAKKFFTENSLEKFHDSKSVGYFTLENELIAVLNNDILVYKLFVTSNIRPDVLIVNNRFPVSFDVLDDYMLVDMIEPMPQFFDIGKNNNDFIDVSSVMVGYNNGYSCILIMDILFTKNKAAEAALKCST